eukprot:2036031-Rhodomonas_salina.2
MTACFEAEGKREGEKKRGRRGRAKREGVGQRAHPHAPLVACSLFDFLCCVLSAPLCKSHALNGASASHSPSSRTAQEGPEHDSMASVRRRGRVGRGRGGRGGRGGGGGGGRMMGSRRRADSNGDVHGDDVDDDRDHEGRWWS